MHELAFQNRDVAETDAFVARFFDDVRAFDAGICPFDAHHARFYPHPRCENSAPVNAVLTGLRNSFIVDFHAVQITRQPPMTFGITGGDLEIFLQTLPAVAKLRRLSALVNHFLSLTLPYGSGVAS